MKRATADKLRAGCWSGDRISTAESNYLTSCAGGSSATMCHCGVPHIMWAYPPGSEVVVILVDDRSLESLGRCHSHAPSSPARSQCWTRPELKLSPLISSS